MQLNFFLMVAKKKSLKLTELSADIPRNLKNVVLWVVMV